MNTSNYTQGRTYKTDDYSIFDTHEYNRPIHDDPVTLDSMKKHGFMSSCAIHCRHNGGDKLKIMRGHHRLHYAKQLKIPVYFTVDDTDVDIYELEGSSKSRWTGSDFLFSRARSGDPECKALLAYQKKNKLPLGSAADLFGGQTSGGQNKVKEIKKGTFKRGDQEHGNRVIQVLDELDQFKLEFSRSSSFVKALSHALRIPDLKFDQFFRKIKGFGSFLHKRATYQDYLEELENLYNRSSKDRLPVKILANAVAKRRQETFGRENKSA